MKFLKLTVLMVSLLTVSQAAFAVGPMAKDDVRDGQLICMGNGSGPKDGHVVLASSGSKSDNAAGPVNSHTAQ